MENTRKSQEQFKEIGRIATKAMIEEIKIAQDELQDAINRLEVIARNNPWATAYIIAPLKIAAGKGSGYMTADPSIDDWVEQLESELEGKYAEDENINCECGYEGPAEIGRDEHGHPEEQYCPKCEKVITHTVTPNGAYGDIKMREMWS